MIRTARLLARTTAFTATSVAVAGMATLGAPAQAATTVTDFGFQGTAYGTRVLGGDLKVTSGRSAFSVVACTRRAGLETSNHIAAATLGDGAVRVGAVTSSNRTWKSATGAHIGSTNEIASVVIDDQDGLTGSLEIQELETKAHAWHDTEGYHATTTTSGVLVVTAGVGAIMTDIIDLPAVQVPGQQYTVPLPKSGEYLHVPGLVRITSDWTNNFVGAGVAHASVNGLRVDLDSTESMVIVGRSWARINGNVAAGVMSGRAFGSEMRLLDGLVTSGRTAVKPLPCPGTRGTWRSTSTAGSSIPGVAAVGVTKSEVYGKQSSDRSASAKTRSTVAEVDLGDGHIVLNAIRAQANLTTSRSGSYTKNSNGTSPGTITVGGQTTTLPDAGTLQLANELGTIETGVVRRTRYGISVTAVKVTLFNGVAANSVLLLGNAQATIRPW